MRNIIYSILALGLFAATSPVYAHHGKGKACAPYWKSCKDAGGDKAAVAACVNKAASADANQTADAAKQQSGQACVAHIEAHQKKASGEENK